MGVSTYGHTETHPHTQTPQTPRAHRHHISQGPRSALRLRPAASVSSPKRRRINCRTQRPSVSTRTPTMQLRMLQLTLTPQTTPISGRRCRSRIIPVILKRIPVVGGASQAVRPSSVCHVSNSLPPFLPLVVMRLKAGIDASFHLLSFRVSG